MDHHCPWLNGCVGHFNHRYFYLYMIYTVLGCVFLMAFGFEILFFEVFPPSATTTAVSSEMPLPPVKDSNSTNIERNDASDHDEVVFSFFSRRSLIMYETFMTIMCTAVLGGLSIWHGMLISRGETSIEAHINRSERKRFKQLGKQYKNPYDFGVWHNWCLFLGMIDGRGWESVLFPSAHPPQGMCIILACKILERVILSLNGWGLHYIMFHFIF